MSAQIISIDTGGTFTDCVLAGGSEALRLLKAPTTLEDQSLGVMHGIRALAEAEGIGVRALLEATELVVHGTTTADNTMIEMNGALTGLITTEGHRDEIEIRRGYKEDIWDPAFPPPIPIAPRRRRKLLELRQPTGPYSRAGRCPRHHRLGARRVFFACSR